MTEELENRLAIWSNNTPESHHRLDYERLYGLVLQSYKDDCRLSNDSLISALRQAGKDDAEKLGDYFGDLYHHLLNILEYLQYPR